MSGSNVLPFNTLVALTGAITRWAVASCANEQNSKRRKRELRIEYLSLKNKEEKILMETTEFKKIVDEIVVSNGLIKRRNSYYLEGKDLMIVLGLQKSSYSSGFYFNLGYIIKVLIDKQYPNHTDGNVRLRFDFELDGKTTDIVDMQDVLKDQFISELVKNIKHYVSPITSIEALKNLILEEPVLLYQTTLTTKQFLKIE